MSDELEKLKQQNTGLTNKLKFFKSKWEDARDIVNSQQREIGQLERENDKLKKELEELSRTHHHNCTFNTNNYNINIIGNNIQEFKQEYVIYLCMKMLRVKSLLKIEHNFALLK
jgi:chromosome segregation ATPase